MIVAFTYIAYLFMLAFQATDLVKSAENILTNRNDSVLIFFAFFAVGCGWLWFITIPERRARIAADLKNQEQQQKIMDKLAETIAASSNVIIDTHKKTENIEIRSIAIDNRLYGVVNMASIIIECVEILSDEKDSRDLVSKISEAKVMARSINKD